MLLIYTLDLNPGLGQTLYIIDILYRHHLGTNISILEMFC